MLCKTCDSFVVPCWAAISSWCNEKIREKKREPVRLRCLPISARETAYTLLRVTILFLLAIGMIRLARILGGLSSNGRNNQSAVKHQHVWPSLLLY